MDLSSTDSEFCFNWLRQNLLVQPVGDEALTWYVTAELLFMDYANAAFKANAVPVSNEEFWTALRLAVPVVQCGKLQARVPVFYGVRYIVDGIPKFTV